MTHIRHNISFVIPPQAGIQGFLRLDTRLRGYDGMERRDAC